VYTASRSTFITPCTLPHVAHSSHRVHCLTWHIHHTVYTASHGTFITPCTLPHMAHSSHISCCVFSHDAGKDVGKTGDAEADLYQAMVWIPPFAHVLVKWFGQLYACDGTHNMSKYGWRAIPLCVVNSLGNPHPVAMVWATSECVSAMMLLADHLSKHLQENGCIDPFSVRRDSRKGSVDPRDLCYQPDWDDPLPCQYACAPAYRLFVKSVLDGQPILAHLPQLDDRPCFISDGGLAFRTFSDCLGWRHVLCKKHLSANNSLSSTTHM
jgi:hypothetical protein